MKANVKIGSNLIWFIAVWFLTLPLNAAITLGSVGSIELTISRIVGILVVIYVTASLAFVNLNRIPSKLFLSTLVFVLYMFAHVFFGGDWIGDFSVFIRAYGSFALLLYLICILEADTAALIGRVIIILAVATALYTIAQYAIFHVSPSLAIDIFGKQAFWGKGSATVRPGGLMLSAGGSASIMTMGFILYMRRYLEGVLNKTSLVLISIIVVGLGLNFTRTFVFLLVPFVFLVLVKYGRWKGLFLYAVLGVLSIGVLVNLLGAERFVNRFNDIPGMSDSKEKKPAFEGRSLLIEIVMNAYNDESAIDQAIGHDYRWASREIEKYYKKTFSLRTGESSTHNDFVWILATLGWFGLIFYIAVVLSLIFSIKGKYQFFGRLFVLFFFVISGIGGESIPIVGHRYIQVMLIAALICESRKKSMKRRRIKLSV